MRRRNIGILMSRQGDTDPATFLRVIRSITLRLFARASLDQFAAIVMITAALAFTLEPTYFVTSQAARGGHAHSHSALSAQQASLVVTHVHADGTMHKHAVDDGTLTRHKKEPGYPNAAIIALLPSVSIGTVASIVQAKLTAESAVPQRGTEPNGPRRPPRTPSIA
jgi:hypothetical protein